MWKKMKKLPRSASWFGSAPTCNGFSTDPHWIAPGRIQEICSVDLVQSHSQTKQIPLHCLPVFIKFCSWGERCVIKLQVSPASLALTISQTLPRTPLSSLFPLTEAMPCLPLVLSLWLMWEFLSSETHDFDRPDTSRSKLEPALNSECDSAVYNNYNGILYSNWTPEEDFITSYPLNPAQRTASVTEKCLWDCGGFSFLLQDTLAGWLMEQQTEPGRLQFRVMLPGWFLSHSLLPEIHSHSLLAEFPQRGGTRNK